MQCLKARQMPKKTADKTAIVLRQTLTARIRDNYARLSKTERRLADAIIDFPGEVASYSATEFAAMAGVAKATVTRLVRRIGFASFEEARRASRAASDWGSPLYLLRKSGATANSAAPLTAHFERCLRNIEKTRAGIDPALLADAVAALAAARRVWLLGFRNSYYLAAYARWQFIQLRDEVHLLAGAGETLAETLAGLDRRDLVIIIGIRRRLPLVDKVTEAAVDAGIRILFIGDTHSPLGGLQASWRFLCETRSLAPLDNHVAPLALIHALAAGLIERTGAKGRARLRRIEALHAELAEL
jgi:DNA-binding MurR/RpiR family transcriptional regulator